jgi:hypothetical protein
VTDHTNAIAIEIARLLGNGQEERKLIPALAMKFPDRRPAEFEEAITDVIALQNLVAAEIAESEQELTWIKAALQKHKKSFACLPHSHQLANKAEAKPDG